MIRHFLLLLLALSQSAVFSQNRSCQKLFIWPFGAESGKQPETTKLLTADLEHAFIKKGCTVFVSNDCPNITQKMTTAADVATMQDIPAELLKELATTTGADKLLIGRARFDNGGGAIVMVTIYTLPGKLLIDSKKIAFSEYELQKDSLRIRKLNQIVGLLPENTSSQPTYAAPKNMARPQGQSGQEQPITSPEQGPSFPAITQPQVVINLPQAPPPPTPPKARPKPELPPPPTSQPQYHEVTFIVGKNVDKISVTGYNNLRLTKRKDGSQEASLNLLEGRYELVIYQDGRIKCNEPFQADRNKTIAYPCQ